MNNRKAVVQVEEGIRQIVKATAKEMVPAVETVREMVPATVIVLQMVIASRLELVLPVPAMPP